MPAGAKRKRLRTISEQLADEERAKKPRPWRDLSEIVALAAKVHGDERAQRAGLVTLLATSQFFYEAHVRMLDDALERMLRARRDFDEATEGERYWREVIDDAARQLDRLEVAKRIEHRNMFKRVTTVRTTAPDGTCPIGETTMHLARAPREDALASAVLRGGRCEQPRPSRVDVRPLNAGRCPVRCSR